MAKGKCPVCKGEGWVIFVRANEGEFPQFLGRKTIQKCDNCCIIENDMEAAKKAKETGIDCVATYPCVIGETK